MKTLSSLFPGWRFLKAFERARAGDRFYYTYIGHDTLLCCPLVRKRGSGGFAQVGRTLKRARELWQADRAGPSWFVGSDDAQLHIIRKVGR